MEDTGALILLFDNEEGRKIWQSRLQGAIYRASVVLALFVNSSLHYLSFVGILVIISLLAGFCCSLELS